MAPDAYEEEVQCHTAPAAVAMVIRPVATRLTRIEDLLVEMRGVLDVHLKRIAAVQKQVDILIEKDRARPQDRHLVGYSGT